MQLDGKIALITGGGSGIGAAVARKFAEAGAQVVISGRRADALETVRASINAPRPVQAIVSDIADRTQVQVLIDRMSNEWGRIDILVNNAGTNIKARKLVELAPEDWDALLETNATGAFNMIHAVLPLMRAQRDGLIISISSISGRRASTLAGAAYSAAKHAMGALTRVVGIEENVHGIRATTILPGDVSTPLIDFRPNAVSDEQRARMLQPDDVAAAALFVATLPAYVCVPELVIAPIWQAFA